MPYKEVPRKQIWRFGYWFTLRQSGKAENVEVHTHPHALGPLLGKTYELIVSGIDSG